jgi:Ni,Fe-hydrogenase III component G
MSKTMTLADIARSGTRAEAHRPFPRLTVTSEGWRRAIKELVEARATLLGLWGDSGAVHMALIEEAAAEIVVLTYPCPDGKFPSVGASHPSAIRLERAIKDLYGLKPVGAADTRPWLDLGFWGVTQPLGANKKSR